MTKDKIVSLKELIGYCNDIELCVKQLKNNNEIGSLLFMLNSKLVDYVRTHGSFGEGLKHNYIDNNALFKFTTAKSLKQQAIIDLALTKCPDKVLHNIGNSVDDTTIIDECDYYRNHNILYLEYKDTHLQTITKSSKIETIEKPDAISWITNIICTIETYIMNNQNRKENVYD